MDRRKAEKDYQVVTESPFVLDGSGFIEGTRSRLFRVNLCDGKIEALSEPLESVSQFAVVDGRVLMSVKKFEVVRGEQDGLVCLDLAANQRRCLIEQGRMRIRQIAGVRDKRFSLRPKIKRLERRKTRSSISWILRQVKSAVCWIRKTTSAPARS